MKRELNGGHTVSATLSTSARIRETLRENAEHRKVFLDPEPLVTARRSAIRFSSAQLVHDLSDSLPACVIDHVECPPETDVNTLTKDVRILASRLRNVNPLEFHLLKCFGVVKTREAGNKNTKSFNFIFTIPKDLSDPLSLREHIRSLLPAYSLTDKLRLAKQLAISVSFVHTLGFVHKNIRPESILILNDSTSGPSLFLVGFKSFRMADGKTLRRGDTDWETNLYRHPTRQWLPEADYVMQHDIYSLGVCLLEIGLGESFVNYEDDGALSSSPISDHFADLRSAGSVKNRLVALAEEFLPRKMGNMYTQVVLNCLTCTDEDNEDFGDESEFVGDDGTLIGVAYIEKILLQLNTISM
ncbi:uncharacterized protein BDV14DRAFT_167764 [Aspergillus stella-maris]|uniref:uncharacterized protein n=1 Tax=Aspergillus stella-maris TaxID=1810926 RepID=UPI003CCD63DA